MPTNILPTNTLLTIGQAAAKLNVSIKTLRRWEKSGLVHPIRNKYNQRMYSEAELNNLVDRKYKPLPQNTIAPQQYQSISAAADAIGVSVKTLRRWDNEGKITLPRDELNRRIFTPELIDQIKALRDNARPPVTVTATDTAQTQPKVTQHHSDSISHLIPVALTPLLSLLPFALVVLPILFFSIIGYKPTLPLHTVDLEASKQGNQNISLQPVDPASPSAYPKNVNPLLSRVPRGEVAGLTVTGGSLLSFENVIDDNFNFGVAGLVEGNQLVSTTTVKPPLIVASQEKVANLNADLLDGHSWEEIANTATASGSTIIGATTLQEAYNGGNTIAVTSDRNLTISGTGTVNIATDLNLNGNSLNTTSSTFNLFNTTATTLNIGGASTTLNLGATTGTTSIKNTLNIAGELNSTNTIAVKPSGDSDDYIYFSTSSDQPGIFFAGATNNYDPGIRVNASSGRIEYRDQGSSTWNALGSSTITSVFTDGGTYVYPTNRESIRVYDSTGINYIDIAHNGTNVLITTNGTTEVRLDNDLVITGNITPATNATYDLGSTTNRFRDIFVSGSSIHLGTNGNEALIGYNTTNNYLSFNPSSDGTPEFSVYDNGSIAIDGILLTATATELNLLTGHTNPLLDTSAIGTTIQTYNPNTSLLGQTIDESELNITNAPVNGYLLSTDGSGNMSWVDPGTFGGSISLWQNTNEQLYPINTNFDVLVGGTSTASATLSLQATTGDLHMVGNLYTGGVQRLSNTGSLTNVTGNISMWTNDVGYLTLADTETWNKNVWNSLTFDNLATAAAAILTTWVHNKYDYVNTASVGATVQPFNANTSLLGQSIQASELDVSNAPADNYLLQTMSDGTLTWVNPSTLTQDNYADSLSFDSGTGTLTLGRSGVLPDLTTSLDGRYQLAFDPATWDQNLWDDLTAANFATYAATLGYITDGNTNWDNLYGFITASSVDTLTNKSGNISMWTNDVGYLTLADTETWNKNVWNSLTFDNLATAAAAILTTWVHNKYDYVNTASVGATVQPFNANTSLLGQSIQASELDVSNAPADNYLLQTMSDGTLTWVNPSTLTQDNYADSLSFDSGTGTLTLGRSGVLPDLTTSLDGRYQLAFDPATWDQNLWDDLTAANFATYAATLGYITDGNTNWDNLYGFITASSVDTLTNKSGNISMWTNDVGYLTLADTETWNKNVWNSLTFDNLATAAAAILTTWVHNKYDYVNTASVGATVQPFNANTSLLGQSIQASELDVSNAPADNYLLQTMSDGTLTWVNPSTLTQDNYADSLSFDSGTGTLTLGRSGVLPDLTTSLDGRYQLAFDPATWDQNLWDDLTAANFATYAATLGYITDGNTNWDNLYGFITASSVDTLTNKSGNISMWTNDVGYLTLADTETWNKNVWNSLTFDNLATAAAAILTTWVHNKYDYVNTASVGATVQPFNANTSLLGQSIQASELDVSNAPADNYLLQTMSDGTLTWVNPSTLTQDNYADSLSFDSGTGTLTLGRSGVLPDLTTSLDGRYQLAFDPATWDQNLWDDLTAANFATYAATLGYITDGNTNWDNLYGFITASSVDTLTNKSGNISMWTNDVGYLTLADTETWNKNVWNSLTFDNLATAAAAILTTWVHNKYDYVNTASVGATVQPFNANTSLLGQSIQASELDVSNAPADNYLLQTMSDGTLTWVNPSTLTQDNYADSLSFDSGTGTLTLGRSGVLPDLTTSLDGRYQLAFDPATWDQNLWDDLTAANFATYAATLGYITDGNTNWDNLYGFITASSVDTLTNKSGNISMWTNDVGYLTLADTETWNKNVWNSLTFDNLATAAAAILTTWVHNKYDYVNTASVGATVQPFNANTSLLGQSIQASELDVSNAPADNYLLQTMSDGTLTWVNPSTLTQDNYADSLSFDSGTGTLTLGRSGVLPDLTTSLDGRYQLAFDPATWDQNLWDDLTAANFATYAATLGYITDGNTNWDNLYGFITASSVDTLTNKSGNISMWTNDVGYLTAADLTNATFWQLNAQQLAPKNTTLDIMTGGTATVSAKFYAQGTTGNGYFAGNLGIGTTAPANKLSVVGNASIGSSTYNVAAPTNGLIVEGNVGIGTTNPSEKLQVGGKAIIRTDALLYDINSHPSSQLTITTDTNQDNYFAGIKFIANNQSSNSSIAWIGTYATGIQSNLVFGTRSGSYYSEKMRIDIAGNLGIGTTNPGYKLEVAGGDLNLTTGTFRMAGIDYGQYFIDSAGTNGYVWTSDGSGRGYWATAPGGSTYTAGNDIDINGTQLDLESQLDFVSTISRDSSNLTLQTTTSGNINLTSAGSINITGDFILTGKASSTSTAEGTLYYDTDDDQLKVYANGKWQADRSTTTLIVAASDSKNKEKADYVADGTDDQTEINAAINALPTNGGAVVLLDGTYNIGNSTTGRITIAKSNVSLVGSGASTVIKRMFDESGDNGLIVIGNGSGTYTKIAVSNLSVDGNNGTYSNSYNHGIYATNTTTYVNLTNNWINNAGGYGIYFASSDANRYNLTGNYIAANTEGGIYAVTYYLNIANNQFIQNGSWGTSGYDIYSPDSGSSITNNVFYLPQYRGIRLSANNVTVGNNTFRGCANYCLFLDSAVNNTITGNTFYQDGSHTAIAVSGSSRNTIANNNINELGNTRNGILLTGSSTNNTLTGNQIYSTNTSAGAAIQIDSGSTGNYLSSNRFSGTGTAAQGTNVLTDSATGTIYGGQTTNGNSNYAFTPTGNVGIGTTGPSSKLSVGGAGVAGAGIYGIGTTYGLYGESTDALGYGVRGYAQSTGTGVFGSNNSTGYGVIGSNTNSGIGGYFTSTSGHALVTGTGNVGIGTTNPGYKLQVYIDSSNEGHVDATGAWARSSDARLKQNITTLTSSLDKIMDLRAVRYDSNSDTLSAPGEGKRIGFIAQELEQIYPEFVNTDANGMKSVAYESLTPVLAGAIQELNLKVDTLGNLPQLAQQLNQLDSQFSLLSVDVATHTNWLTDLKDQIVSLFSRQTAVETQTNLLTATVTDLQTQVASLSAAPTPQSPSLVDDVGTLSARISYLEQQVATGLAPEPVSIASVAGAVDNYLSTQLPAYLSDYQAKVDLALELTASQSALIATLLESPVSSESSVVNDLTTQLPDYLSLSSLSVGDIDANTLTVGLIGSATGQLDILAGLMTLDTTGSVVTVNGDLVVTGLARLNEVTAAKLSAPVIDEMSLQIASLSAHIASLSAQFTLSEVERASLSAQVASLSAQVASPSAATATDSAQIIPSPIATPTSSHRITTLSQLP